jgi:hypothetical protein
MSSKRMQGDSRGSEHFQEFVKIRKNRLITESLKFPVCPAVTQYEFCKVYGTCVHVTSFLRHLSYVPW